MRKQLKTKATRVEKAISALLDLIRNNGHALLALSVATDQVLRIRVNAWCALLDTIARPLLLSLFQLLPGSINLTKVSEMNRQK